MSLQSSSSRVTSIDDQGCVEFHVGNPQVSVTSGTLRLYKGCLVYPETRQVICVVASTVLVSNQRIGALFSLSSQVALVSVPSYIPLLDLIRFLNEWNNKDCRMRVIRTADRSGE